MTYDIDIDIKGEQGATVDQFVSEITEVKQDLNDSWAKVKAQLPADQQVAGEVKVRTVLLA